MEKFIEQILKNLEANGFPTKPVSLPTEKMYEIADNKGLNFNQVLDLLRKDHEVESTIETERIIFRKSAPAGDQADMMKKAQEAMSKMSPEELSKIQEMYMNMSDDEKAEILKKGKEMGLI